MPGQGLLTILESSGAVIRMPPTEPRLGEVRAGMFKTIVD